MPTLRSKGSVAILSSIAYAVAPLTVFIPSALAQKYVFSNASFATISGQCG